MTDAEYELARLKEAIAKRLDWEKLWEEQTARAEAAERERDELRDALKYAHDLMFEYGFSSNDLRPVLAALEAKP